MLYPKAKLGGGMREFIGVILVLGAFPVFFICLFALFKPLKTLMLGSRKRAGAGIGLSLVMFIVGAITFPALTPEQLAEIDAAEAERAAARKLETDAAAAEVAEVADDADAELTAAVKGLWTEVNNQLRPCDNLGSAVAESASVSDPDVYQIFPLVQRAEQVCRNAAYEVSQIRVPNTIPREFRRGFDEAFDSCRDAYYIKSSAYSSMGKVLDGDTRPSVVTEAQSAAEASQLSSLRCAASFMTVAMEAGVNSDQFIDPSADGEAN